MNSDFQKIMFIRTKIEENFTSGDWQEIGLFTGLDDYIDNHPRLLRSLHFGDEDYPECVLGFLKQARKESPQNLDTIKEYLDKKYPSDNNIFVSQKRGERTITFSPNAFSVPEISLENDLVSVMMPFEHSFDNAYKGIQQACKTSRLRCIRADAVWENSNFMQDIFNLIFKSSIVVVDFSSKNPNVMYETGIAHTLGKNVVPITQNMNDLPSDLRHHKALLYLNNEQGITELSTKLSKRLSFIHNDQFPF
ncbi:hypothetical protein [Cobetia sp. 5-25-4-2]|uniref:hypothetical protein n=1 Tax=Cobetia sp. 5-25-4-2 TaxID=2737459 RepID=UPI0015966AFF|nr:hypothetical protein [Cobetia sp. 5-25-4-2]